MGRLRPLPRLEILTCASLLAGQAHEASGADFTQQECERAQSIASVRRRDQFLAGRRLAKRMLSETLGGKPNDWPISTDANAKPRLAGHGAQLSIAHSGPFVACSIASQAVGIDIEHLARARPVADMARLVCSSEEQAALHGMQGDAATLCFMQWWTRKEARLKQRDLPFGFAELRAIQTTEVDAPDADVATWRFQEPKLMLSLACDDLSGLTASWPDHWQLSTVQWHRYCS